jgi:hypothetical protein
VMLILILKERGRASLTPSLNTSVNFGTCFYIKAACLTAPNKHIFQFQVLEAFLNSCQRHDEQSESTKIGEISIAPVMDSEESSELSDLSDLSDLSPPGSFGTSFGAGHVHDDTGDLPIYTATDQTPTLEDNDPPRAGVFGDREGNIGKKNDLWSRRNVFRTNLAVQQTRLLLPKPPPFNPSRLATRLMKVRPPLKIPLVLCSGLATKTSPCLLQVPMTRPGGTQKLMTVTTSLRTFSSPPKTPPLDLTRLPASLTQRRISHLVRARQDGRQKRKKN